MALFLENDLSETTNMGMNDKPKVISELERNLNEIPAIPSYLTHTICRRNAIKQVITMLERQNKQIKALEVLAKRNEPVTPVREVGSYSQIFRCRNCDTLMVFQKQKYCHECGQAVKWDA